MQQNVKKKENDFLICAYLLLTSHSIYRCLNYMFRVIGVSIPYLMDAIYLGILILAICLLWKNNVKRKALFRLIGVYFFFFISYLWTVSEAKEYFKTADMKILFIIYIPISILCISRISNWDELFYRKSYLIITDTLVTLNLFAKISGIDQSNYMSYSYDLLPIWAITFIAAFCYEKKMQWFFLTIGIIEGIVFGSRGPLIWLCVLVILIFCCDFFRKKEKIKYAIRILGIVLFFLVILWYILPNLMTSEYARYSYVINRLYDGSINSDAGRNEIYVQCRDIIKQMGLNVYGMFYYRTILTNSSYAHNIIYELLMTMGWLFGGMMLIRLLFVISIPIIVQKKNDKIKVFYFICVLFLRYFISGSIFDEGNFWIFLGAMYSLNKKN